MFHMQPPAGNSSPRRRKAVRPSLPPLRSRDLLPLTPEAERGLFKLAKKLKKSDAKPHILLVEDSEHDAIMFEQALLAARVDVRLTKLRDGQDALYYLTGLAANTDREEHPLPDIILLDLNIPRVPGLEVLRHIREQEELTDAVIIALTGSKEASDLQHANRLLVDAYLVKPHTFQGLVDLVHDINRKWLKR
jgi:CheY-like chemotaxis protein